jgi:hypothetical protein
MSGTHGDLFGEIGKLVLAAHAGQTIDLRQKSEELAHRYWNLGVSSEMLAKAIARALGAVGVSWEIVSDDGHARDAELPLAGDPIRFEPEASEEADTDDVRRSRSALFPSGVRLALLS